MRLLICTQVDDEDDSDLGFFHRWIEEFRKHAEVEVITLQSLGSGSAAQRALRLLRLCSQLHYDAVFVHMNPEYLIAAGWLWRLQGKKIALWYTHKSVNLKLRIAEKFANIIFTASKESFRLKSKKVHVMGHGIDTDFFSPDPQVTRGQWLLSVGRLMQAKRHDLAIRAAVLTHKELRIAGEGPEKSALESLAQTLGAQVQFLGGLTQSQLRDQYREAALLLHTSETGSLDKVVLEALACGLPVRTDDPALKHLEDASPDYVRREHSLSKLIPRILAILSA